MNEQSNGTGAKIKEEIAARIKAGEPVRLAVLDFDRHADASKRLTNFMRDELHRGYIRFYEEVGGSGGNKDALRISMGALPSEKRDRFISMIVTSSLKFEIARSD